jgi:DNA-binding CsgD family transcriptional regulator
VLTPLQRLELLEGYAQASAMIDHLDEAAMARQEAVAICHVLGDRARESSNLCRLSRHLTMAGRNAEGYDACHAAIAVLDDSSLGLELARAYSNYAYHQMLNRENAEAIHEGRRAIDLAQRFQDNVTLMEAYNFVGSALILVGDFEQGRDLLEQSLQVALADDAYYGVGDALGNLGSAFGEMYQFDDAHRYLAAGIAYCAERDQDFQRLYMRSWQALSHCYQGRWDAVAEAARDVLQRPGVAVVSRIMALVALGRMRVRRGDPDVWTALDEALELAKTTATLQRLGPVRAARAEAAWLAGDADQTAREARSVLDLAIAQQHPWFAGELAYWRWLAGDLDTLPECVAVPFKLQVTGDASAAAAAWERLLCPYEAARALAEHDDEDALRAALDAFERLGARPMAVRVARRMRERGLRAIPRGPRPATRANPAGLTARQVAVLRLIADGFGNRAIAERLYISPKTVEHHVSAILTKLDAGDRVQAVQKARRLQLLSQP